MFRACYDSEENLRSNRNASILALWGSLTQLFNRRGERALLVRRMQIEINAAKRALPIALAENNGDLPVQSDAVTHAFAATFVGLDRLLHQRVHGRMKVLRRFLETNDVPVV